MGFLIIHVTQVVIISDRLTCRSECLSSLLMVREYMFQLVQIFIFYQGKAVCMTQNDFQQSEWP